VEGLSEKASFALVVSWTWLGGGPVLKDKEHNVPTAGWNIVLLQLLGQLIH